MNKAPLLSFDDALAALLAAVSPLADTETVSTLDGAGRVLATDLRSGLNVPLLTTRKWMDMRCAWPT